MPISIAMILAAVAGGRLADRISPRRIVEVGLMVLFLGLIGLFASISPQLTSPVFSISLAFFGAGIGLVVSQLGNVTMSAVDESRSNEVGGLQGAAQSLGSSLGTALIGAVLLAGLTTDFHNQINSDDNIPAKVQKQIVNGTEQGVPMVSRPTVEKTVKKAGLPPNQAQSVVDAYSGAQIDALKRALLAASVFALVALWLAGDLPRLPLGETDPESAPPAAGAQPLTET
jgi:MFS family permease